MYDNEKHAENLYEQGLVQPQLCGYELNPFEVQPDPPIIGKFKDGKMYNEDGTEKPKEKKTYQMKMQDADDFKRRLIFAVEFAQEEEKFIRDQLTDGLRLGYFNMNSQNELDEMMMAGGGDVGIRPGFSPPRQQRLISQFMNVAESSPLINQPMFGDDHDGSDDEMLEENQPSRRRRRQRHRPRQNLLRLEEGTNEDIENTNELQSQQLQTQPNGPDNEYVEEDEPSDQDMEDEEAENDLEGMMSSEADRKSYRENDEDMEQLNVNRQRNDRTARANRRNNTDQNRGGLANAFDQLHQSAEGVFGQDDSELALENQRRSGRRSRRRQVIPSGETSQFIEPRDDQSNYGENNDIYADGPPTGAERQLRNRHQENERHHEHSRPRRLVRRQQNIDQESDLMSLDQNSQNQRSRRQTVNLGRDRNARRAGLRRQIMQNPDLVESSHNESVERNDRNRRSSRNMQQNGQVTSRAQRRLRRHIGDHNEGHASYQGNEEDSFQDEYDDEQEILDDVSDVKAANSKRKVMEQQHGRHKKRQNHDVDDESKNREEDDQKVEWNITSCTFLDQPDHLRDDVYSQRGSKQQKKGAKIQKEGKFKKQEKGNDKLDNIFTLSEKQKVINQKHEDEGKHTPFCSFCLRKMDRHLLIGPFVLENNSDLHKQEFTCSFTDALDYKKEIHGIYFHQHCLEYNSYVRYDQVKDKYVNIRNALRHLVEYQTFSCYRCLGKGATVQCESCDRSFHGHYCSLHMYTLSQDYENTSFICIFCKNSQNFHHFIGEGQAKVASLHGNEVDKLRKAIKKDYILETAPFGCQYYSSYFQPQLDDEVIYFYQGHEKFHQANNCFFYAGNKLVKGSTDLPWMRMQYLKNKTLEVGQVNCVVKNIQHRFCSLNSTQMIIEYGDCSSDIQQDLKIISYIELEITDNDVLSSLEYKNDLDKKRSFVIEMFPSEAEQFILPVQIYEQKKKVFDELYNAGKIIGQRFKTHRGTGLFRGGEVKVEEVSPREPDSLKNSLWQTIVVSEVKQITDNRHDRGRRAINRGPGPTQQAERHECVRINFWDLIMTNDQEKMIIESNSPSQSQSIQSIAKSVFPQAFGQIESQRLLDAIRLFLHKNGEMSQFFKVRVSELIADDYKSYISHEMWLDLIIERLKAQYYRSQNQLWSDIEQIHLCSKIYNGEDDELSIKSKSLTDKLKKELRQYCNTSMPSYMKNCLMNIGSSKSLSYEKGATPQDGLGFQMEGNQQALQNFQEAQSASVIQLSQASQKKAAAGEPDASMEIYNEAQMLEQAIQESLAINQESGNSLEQILNAKAQENDGKYTKTKSKSKRNGRAVCDDDEEYDDGDIEVDVNKAINGTSNTFGSDDQNFNQNNIGYGGSIELRLNKDANAKSSQGQKKQSCKKSVEILETESCQDNMYFQNGSQNNKKRRGRPKKQSTLTATQQSHISKAKSNPYVEMCEEADSQHNKKINLVIKNAAFNANDFSDKQLEIHLEKDDGEMNLLNNNHDDEINNMTIPLIKNNVGKQSPESMNNSVMQDDKNNFDSVINLGSEKNGLIGKKRVRNEISLGEMDGYADNSFTVSLQQNEGKQGGIVEQRKSTGVRQSTRNKRQRIIQ